jgi:predicted phosphodiesterase
LLADVHWTADLTERAAWHNAYDFVGLAERIDKAFAWFSAEGVDDVVLAGDLTHHGDAAALDALLRYCLGRSAQRLLLVAGNHDHSGASAPLADAIARAETSRIALASPAGVTHGNLRLAGIHARGMNGSPQSSLEHRPAVGAWGDAAVLVVSHFPLLSHAALLADHGLAHPGDVHDRDAIARSLIERAAPTIVVSGHVHARVTATCGPVLQLTQASLIEPPFDAAIVELAATDAGVRAQRWMCRTGTARVAYEPALSDADGAWTFDGTRWTACPRTAARPRPAPRRLPA